MNYVIKICPICRNEFLVLDIAEEKAVYCTIKCLSEGSVAKNLNIEPNNYFHRKDYKKTDGFSENMQI